MFPQFLVAQVSNEKTPFDLTIGDLYKTEVVTATKTRDLPIEVPANIYVITHQMISQRGYKSLRDLLQDLPHIIVSYKSSSENLDLYSVNGIVGSEKFLILMDGVRINSTMGADQTIAEAYSLQNVERVEVVIGPSSVLYGADAFVGVINIITFDYAKSPIRSISLDYGSFNTYRASGIYSFKSNDLSFGLSAKIYHSDEPFFPKFYPDRFSWFYRYQLTGEMMLFDDTVRVPLGVLPWNMETNSSNLLMKVSYRGFEAGMMSFFEQHSSAIGDKPSTAIYSKQSTYAHSIKNYYLKFSHSSRDTSFSFKSVLSAQDFKVLPYSAFINQFTSYNIAYKYEHSRSIKWENLLVYKFGRSYLSLGLVSESFDVIPKTGDLPRPYDENLSPEEQNLYYFGTNYVDTSGRSLMILQDIYHIKYSNLGAYFQLKTNFSKVNFVFGARSEYDTRYGPNFIPRAGLVLRPSENFFVKFVAGKAYMAPSPHKAYQHFGTFYPVYDSAGNVVGLKSDFWRLANPDLQPEHIMTYELNLGYLYRDLALNVNFFYNNLTNLIVNKFVRDTVFHDVPVSLAMVPVNQGSGYTIGAVFSMNYMFYLGRYKLNWNISYTYTDGMIEREPLFFVPRNSVKTQFDLILRRKFSIYGSFEYRSPVKVKGFENLYTPPFVFSKITANYNISKKNNYRLRFFLSVSNIFDLRQYSPTQGTFGLSPQDPLRVEIGINFWEIGK